MPKYRVEIDGKTVWSDTTKGDGTVAHFPDEYTARPQKGEVHLIIDDEIVGVQTPLGRDEALSVVNDERAEADKLSDLPDYFPEEG